MPLPENLKAHEGESSPAALQSFEEMEAATRKAIRLVRKLLKSRKGDVEHSGLARDAEHEEAPATGFVAVETVLSYKSRGETILLVEDEVGLELSK